MSAHKWKDSLFYIGLALLFTHELDAMSNHEWRVLPGLRSLSDGGGELTFILAHIPIFAIIVACVASLNRTIRVRARIIASIFLVVHAVLHYLFSGHDAYEFSSSLSTSLIYAAAAFGSAYLTVGLLNQK